MKPHVFYFNLSKYVASLELYISHFNKYNTAAYNFFAIHIFLLAFPRNKCVIEYFNPL